MTDKTLVIRDPGELTSVATRRNFLRMMAVGGTVLLMPAIFEACGSDKSTSNNNGGNGAGTVTLDLSNDTGILNYAYALEQLEAAFYTAVIGGSVFSSLPAAEQEVFGDLQKHEVIHREFFKAALGSSAIPTIAFNTTTVGNLMKDRATLLSSSQLLEDTGVSAYNGAGKYLASATYLTLAGKIVSVEARHAAAIRDIRDGNGGTKFAGDDVVNAQGLDVKAEPGTVLTAVAGLGVIDTTKSTIKIGTQPKGTATADAPAPNPS